LGGGRRHDVTPGGPRLLQAGPLTAVLDRASLRDIRLGGLEMLAAIQPTARDRDWVTIQPDIVDVAVTVDPGSGAFAASIALAYRGPALTVDARVVIQGMPSGVTVSFHGNALQPSVVHRLGLVALLPAGLAGVSFDAIASGGPSSGRFPTAVASERIATDLETVAWSVDGIACTLAFAGIPAEIEDQRAFGDASFKAYSPPLHVPHPIELATGQTVSTGIYFELRGDAPPHAGAVPSDQVLVVTDVQVGTVPPVGTGWTRPLEAGERRALAALGLSHLRIALDGTDPSWSRRLMDVGRDAAATGMSLQLEAVGFDDDDLDRLAAAAAAAGSGVAGVLVFGGRQDDGLVTTSVPRCDAVAAAFAAHGPRPTIGGGTRANLAELLTVGDVLAPFDTVALGITPQVHAEDPATILDNLAVVPDIVSTAAALAHGRPLDVVCAMRPRFNAYASPPERAVSPDRGDPRLHTALGATWLVATLAGVLGGPIDRLTVGEASGPGGLAASTAVAGEGVTPDVAAILSVVASGVATIRVTAPDGISALAIRNGAGTWVMAANRSHRSRTLRLAGDAVRDAPDAALRLEAGAAAIVRLGP
jgi:hypothetical protein